ncbi:ATP-dependent RNA helicase HrpA [Marinobacteraceae bacterium S3BR75-40.1]
MTDHTDNWADHIRHQLAVCRQREAARIIRRLGKKHLSEKDRADVESWLEAGKAGYDRRAAQQVHIEYPQQLPVSERVEDIARALSEHQVVIVAGETGSGKTTQLPKICLEAGRGRRGLIGHTQPRRLAARSVTHRLAEELQVEGSRQVGLKIRFTDQTDEDSLVKVMTDGILLAEIGHDRFLDQYDTLIIDEAHERSLNIDFIMGYLKRLLPKRPDLKIIITSATIEVDRFSAFFEKAPVIEVSGRIYPVDVRYRPLAGGAEDDDMSWPTAIEACVDEIEQHEREASKPPGDILVFLPGEREIRQVSKSLRHANLRHTEVLPLYARLSSAEQQRVFQPHKGRRIVLSTNVAETSLTVPGIRYVIDTGLARLSRYSVRSKIQRLPIEPVSQASANQRKGRCGRVAPGICFRLYDEADFLSRPEYTDPEILRTNLASVILQMAVLGLGEVKKFPFLDAPENKQVNDGYKLLEELAAVTHQRKLTATGRKMAKMPIDPRLARMLMEADEMDCLAEVLVITAGLSVQDPRERPADKQQAADQQHAEYRDKQSDFKTLLNLWEFYEEQRQSLSQNQLRRLCQKRFLNYMRMREWRDVHRQLTLLARDNQLRLNKDAASYEAVHQAVLSGLLGQIAVKQEKREYLGTRNRKLTLFPGSGVIKSAPKWIMAAEIVETSRVFARMVGGIQPDWIEPLAGHLVKRHHFEPHWERKRGQVVAFERVNLYGLDIVARRKINYAKIAPQETRELFIRRALVEGDYDTRAPFVDHNKALVASVEAIEDKTRRRDLLVDDEELFRFYDERLPQDIVSARHFERWWKDCSDAQLAELELTREQLLNQEPGQATEVAYPDELEWQGIRYRLTYRFEPGAPDDGVTLTVPLMALKQVPVHRIEWLVPGLLEEKAQQLVRSLPKALRRNFVPVPDFVGAALNNLTPCNEPLTRKLGEQLERMTGVRIPEDAWSADQIEPYLRMNVRVVDRQGKVQAEGRDIHRLLEQLEGRSEQALAERESTPSETEVEDAVHRAWDFERLPETREIDQGGVTVRVYPGLEDTGDGARDSQWLDPETAREATRQAQARLALNALGNSLEGVEKRIPHFKDSALLFAPIGQKRALLDDFLMAAAKQHFLGDQALPRDKAAFEERLQARRGDFSTTLEQLGELLHRILRRHHQLKKGLKGNVPLSLAASLSDLKFQLANLVYPGFLSQTPPQWLEHFPRYLEAAEIRLEKMPREMGREREFLHEFQPRWDRYAERKQQFQRQGVTDEELEQYRWMLEEYRVSFFAQQLGTALSVSPQRLDRQWEKVRV